jgi:hypothetical protein
LDSAVYKSKLGKPNLVIFRYVLVILLNYPPTKFGGQYQDRMTETERNETESNLGQNRNETELFWSVGMRPNHVFAPIGTRSIFFFGHRNETELFWSIGMRPNHVFAPIGTRPNCFFKHNESAHESVKLVVLVRDSCTRPQNRAAQSFFIIDNILYNFRPRKDSKSHFDKYTRDRH